MKGFYSSRKKEVGGRITAREKITMYAKIILFLGKIIAYRCPKTLTKFATLMNTY